MLRSLVGSEMCIRDSILYMKQRRHNWSRRTTRNTSHSIFTRDGNRIKHRMLGSGSVRFHQCLGSFRFGHRDCICIFQIIKDYQLRAHLVITQINPFNQCDNSVFRQHRQNIAGSTGTVLTQPIVELLNRAHHENFGFIEKRLTSSDVKTSVCNSLTVRLGSGSIDHTLCVRTVRFGLTQSMVRVL